MKIDRFSKSSHLAQSLTPICFTGQLVRRLVEKAAKALGFQNSTMLNQNFTLEISTFGVHPECVDEPPTFFARSR